MKRIWKAGLAMVAVIALAGAAAGFVAAQTDGGGDAASQGERRVDFLTRLAANLGVTVEEFQAALVQTQLQMVDEALANGDITEEQAAQARTRIESGEGGFFPGGKHRPQHRAYGVKMEVAEFIGVTPEELMAGLESGQSVAQVAEANGVTEQELTDYLLGEIEAKLADAVESGRIDQAKADEILANAPARIEEMINRQGLAEKRHGGHAGAGFRQSDFRGGSAPMLEPEAVSPTF